MPHWEDISLVIFVPGVGLGCTSHPTLSLILSPNTMGLKFWVLPSLMDDQPGVCLLSEATLGEQRPQTWVSLTPVPGSGSAISLLCCLT